MKLLLAMPPVSLLQDQDNSLFFPIGIVCLASFLREKGIEVRIFHSLPYTIIDAVKDYSPGIVGLSCDSSNFASCFELSKKIKQIDNKIVVILGGIHATCLHQKILEHIDSIDFVVRGEGEYTSWELIKALIQGKDKRSFNGIQGITYRCNGKIMTNAARPFISNLDELPLLDYGLLDIQKIMPFSHPLFYDIHSGRGCSFNCEYCASVGLWEQRCRSKSAEQIVKEIQIYKEKYGFVKVFLNEQNFPLNKKRVYSLCNLLIKKKVNIKWSVFAHPATIDIALLSSMKDAGCVRIIYGVESFSDTILNLMGRRYNSRRVIELLNYTSQMGIEATFGLILGFPGETEDTLNETVKCLYLLDPNVHCYNINIFELHPGSRIYNKAKEIGLVNDAMWFSGFKTQDFIPLYYRPRMVELITKAKDTLEKKFSTSKQQLVINS